MIPQELLRERPRKHRARVICRTFSLVDYDRLNFERPELKVKLLEFLVGVLTSRLREANDQIGRGHFLWQA